MLTSTSNQDHSESQTADVLIPLIRAAATIGFAIAPCSLGFVIIAVSERMIRSIMVGDDPEMLVSDLQSQFPNDAFEVADKDEGLMAQVVDLIDCPEQAAELPLDIRGTEFQMRVWEALQNVPAGSAVSYASLAEQIGAKIASGIVVLGVASNGKVSLVGVVSKDLQKKFHAGNIIKKVAEIVGGSGGGRLRCDLRGNGVDTPSGGAA